ncbi:MAG: tape measure protein, partial [Hyphomicrobiales bacterium]
GTFKRSARSAGRLDKAMASATLAVKRLVGAYAALELGKGIVRSIDQFTRLENSLRVAGLEGEALNEKLNELFEAADRQVQPVDALVQLYSRLSMAQQDLGASTAEITQFTEDIAKALRVQGSSAAESRGALMQLSQALGGAVVRAEEFNSINEGARPILQAVAAGLNEAGGSVSKLRQLVIDGKVSSQDFFRAFQAGAPMLEERLKGVDQTSGQAFTRLGNALVRLAGTFENASNIVDGLVGIIDRASQAIAGFDGFLGRLSQSAKGYEAQTVETLENILQNSADYTGSFKSLSDEQIQKINEIIAAKKQLLALDQSHGDLLKSLSDSTQSLSGPGIGTPSIKPIDLGTVPGTTSDASSKVSKIDRVIEVLKNEAAAYALSSEAQRLNNELTKAGVGINTEAGQKIAELVSLIEDHERANNAAAIAQRKFDDAMYLAETTGMTLFDSLTSGANDFSKTLEDLAKQLLRMIAQAALFGSGPLANLMGTSISSGGSGGAVGAIAASFGGFRAGGGDVQAGKAYVVGEKGPELMLPGVSGTVVPNFAMQPPKLNSRDEGGAMHITLGVSVDESGSMRPFVESVSGDVAVSVVRGAAPTIITRSVQGSGSALAGGGFDKSMERFGGKPKAVVR